MNLFVLDYDFELNAQYHVDKHVVKMPVEAAQILCTVRRIKGDDTPAYKATHIHHPCVLWAAHSRANYIWTIRYGQALCKEYTYRYGKTHGCLCVIDDCSFCIPEFSNHSLTTHVCAMPNQYSCMKPTVVEAYREYYNREKQHLFSWKLRDKPYWIK